MIKTMLGRLQICRAKAHNIEFLPDPTAIAMIMVWPQIYHLIPKKAVTELANAMGKQVWLVEAGVAATINIPFPDVHSLALSVLFCNEIQSSPHERLGLITRLAKQEHAESSDIRRAIVKILTGQITAPDVEQDLYYVRSRDSDKVANQESLRILLNLLGRQWCAIDASLVEPIPLEIIEVLRVRALDSGVLHKLLKETLSLSVDWHLLDKLESIQLLAHLHSIRPEEHNQWRKMPLHRMFDGSRGSISDRTLKASGELKLPKELESEISLIDPDQELVHLYNDVHILDNDGILHAMLVSQRPYQFANRIIQILGNGEHTTLPHNSNLLELLANSKWLPLLNSESGVAPNKLLVMPGEELQRAVALLAEIGGIGDCKLIKDINSDIWQDARDLILEILKRPGPVRQIQGLVSALDKSKVLNADNGAYALLSNFSGLDASFIDDVLHTTLADSLPGWGLLRAAANAVGIKGNIRLTDASTAIQKTVVNLAHSFCGLVPPARQLEAIRTLAAACPAKDSPAGRVFRKFIETFSTTDGFSLQVLPKIELPTQDGQWRSAKDIARSASGVARRHRLISNLREPLGLRTDEIVEVDTTFETQSGYDTADILNNYFKSWDGCLPNGAVGAFLSLLGNGKDDSIVDLSERWLGADISVEGMRQGLIENTNHDPCSTVRVFVSSQIAHGSRVEVLNLLNKRVFMEAEVDSDTIFASDPVKCSSTLGHYWEINLRAVDHNNYTAHDLISLLGNSVNWWTVHALRLDYQIVQLWWSRWGTGSQAQVGPVQASIHANLPLTLQQLDVRECEKLKDALQHAQRAQRRREQSPTRQIDEAIRIEREALSNLASLIKNEPDNQRFIWNRVQDMMHRYGYREDSVLLELSQNADDALSQAAEIATQRLPRQARKLIVRLATDGNVPIVDIIHYGRPINDTGGAAFPAGRDRQWDQDLYYMMLLNLSAKPGEVSGQSTVASTTGRFGLGFKSVHLVSESPIVVSGFLAFAIAGGLLPIEKTVPKEPALQPIQGHQVTRIRLPLRSDVDAEELIYKMFLRFDYAKTLLPAFAREIRQVIVDGSPHAGISSFDGEPIKGAPGWCLAKDMTNIPGHGRWRLLRFRPADVNSGSGTEALIIGLRENMPDRLPSEIPFLWNVTPTSEGWGCGYAINGPFKLDPGRTHVSLDDSGTIRAVERLGETLGKGLIDLHDVLIAESGNVSKNLPTGSDAIIFLASLWKVLATGIDTEDDLRQRLLLKLQGPGQGLSAWMHARAAVPSGLPKPFDECLPVVKDEGFKVATDGLGGPEICKAFTLVADLAILASKHRVVTSEVARYLKILLKLQPRKLRPSDLFHDLIEFWECKLTVDRLHALRPLSHDDIWNKIIDNFQIQHNRIVAYSISGELVSIRKLLLPEHINGILVDSNLREELRRSAMAPDSMVLDCKYIENDDDLSLYRRLRMGHSIDSKIMASWYASLESDKRPAGLRYLLDGELQKEVLKYLIPSEQRPDWLKNYEVVLNMLENLGEERWRVNSLLAALFPDRFVDIEESTGKEPPMPEPQRKTFFERLKQWWDDENVRRDVIEWYEIRAWPDWLRSEGLAQGLRNNSVDHWLGLFVLGACRSLGRAKASHHRNFVELTRQNGWWDVFKNPEDSTAWMNTLRSWQDSAIGKLTYQRWMSLFPSIYQFSRYLDKYQRLVLTAGKRSADLYNLHCLLAPRVDDALTGAGFHFDAPPAPLNMGLHWIMRELVRLGLLTGKHIYQDCWVPAEQVLKFLRRLGLNLPDDNIFNSEKAKKVYDFLIIELGTATPNLHRAFDIPFRYLAKHADTQKQLGLED
jgi:hypothetical protein